MKNKVIDFLIKYMDFFKAVSIFLMAVGVCSGYHKIIGCSAIVAILIVCLDKERFSNFRDVRFREVVFSFGIYLAVMMGISILQSDFVETKNLIKNIEKISPFLIICFLIGNFDRILTVAFYGMVTGILINDVVLIEQIESVSKFVGLRIGGLFGHPNKLGSICTILIPVFLFFASYFKRNRYIYYISLGIIANLFGCLFLAKSRGAWIAVIAEVVAIIGIFSYKEKYIRSFKFGIFLLIILGMVSIGSFVYLNGRSYDYERVLLWTAAIEMFMDYPILGVGVSNWSSVYLSSYISDLAKEPYLANCHNLFLHLLSTTGVLGLLAYIYLIGTQVILLKSYSKRDDKSIIGFSETFLVIIVGMFMQNMVDVLSIARDYLALYYFILGICLVYFQNKDKQGFEH